MKRLVFITVGLVFVLSYFIMAKVAEKKWEASLTVADRAYIATMTKSLQKVALGDLIEFSDGTMLYVFETNNGVSIDVAKVIPNGKYVISISDRTALSAVRIISKDEPDYILMYGQFLQQSIESEPVNSPAGNTLAAK